MGFVGSLTGKVSVIKNIISNVKRHHHHNGKSDALNMRTYVWYDWMLVAFGLLLFGSLCLMMGCMVNRRCMKHSRNAMENRKEGEVFFGENDDEDDEERQFRRRSNVDIDLKIYNEMSSLLQPWKTPF